MYCAHGRSYFIFEEQGGGGPQQYVLTMEAHCGNNQCMMVAGGARHSTMVQLQRNYSVGGSEQKCYYNVGTP